MKRLLRAGDGANIRSLGIIGLLAIAASVVSNALPPIQPSFCHIQTEHESVAIAILATNIIARSTIVNLVFNRKFPMIFTCRSLFSRKNAAAETYLKDWPKVARCATVTAKLSARPDDPLCETVWI